MPNPSDYIGKIVYGRFPYFDMKTNMQKYKARPLLIIGTEYDTIPCDLNVLPVSSITKEQYINKEYDLKLDNEQCNLLKLSRKPSYIRIHKQSTVNSRDISSKTTSDLKFTYPDIFEKVRDTQKVFNDTLFQ